MSGSCCQLLVSSLPGCRWLVCVGTCLVCLMAAELRHAAHASPPELPTLPDTVQKSIRSQRAADPVMTAPSCQPACPELRRAEAEHGLNAAAPSAFELINERRELRYRWKGSNDGFREQSLKLRVSRNRSALMWEGRFR